MAPGKTAAKRTPSRRKRKAEPRGLTAKQAEALAKVHDHNGDIAAAARELGRDYATIKDHYSAGMKKLGRMPTKAGRQALPHDRRGQVDVADDDQGPAPPQHRGRRG